MAREVELLHKPGDTTCRACGGLASVHKGCKRTPKGVVHTIEEQYGEGGGPSLWRRCDACGISPRGEEMHENWHLYEGENF